MPQFEISAQYENMELGVKIHRTATPAKRQARIHQYHQKNERFFTK